MNMRKDYMEESEQSQHNNNEHIRTMISYLMNTFYDVSMTDEKLDVWSQHLSKFSAEDVKQAFISYMNKNKGFVPNLAAVISELNVREDEQNSIRALQITADADKAWSEIIRAINEGGGIYSSPDFGSNIIHNAIERVGGWSAICMCDLSQLPWIKKDFCRIYTDLAKNPELLTRISHVGNTAQIVRRDALGYWVKDERK